MTQGSLSILHGSVFLKISAQCAPHHLKCDQLSGNLQTICDRVDSPFEEVDEGPGVRLVEIIPVVPEIELDLKTASFWVAQRFTAAIRCELAAAFSR